MTMKKLLLHLLMLGALAATGFVLSASPQQPPPPVAAAIGDSPDTGEQESLLCRSCHKFNGQGADIAGDLGSLKQTTPAALRQALRDGLNAPSTKHVLAARLRNGGVLPVVRRAWTGALYDLGSAPPQPHDNKDFESITEYPAPGWLHPAEARAYDDDTVDKVARYLQVNNTFGEELRAAQQKEADWELTDRNLFAEIVGMKNSCNGLIPRKIAQIKVTEAAAYDAWHAYYDKWVAEDVDKQEKRRQDPAPVESNIKREQGIITDTQAEIAKVNTDILAIRLRQGDTAKGEALLASLKDRVEAGQKRIEQLMRQKQRILDFNTEIDERISEDHVTVEKLDSFHKDATGIYDDRIAEYQTRCDTEIRR